LKNVRPWQAAACSLNSNKLRTAALIAAAAAIVSAIAGPHLPMGSRSPASTDKEQRLHRAEENEAAGDPYESITADLRNAISSILEVLHTREQWLPVAPRLADELFQIAVDRIVELLPTIGLKTTEWAAFKSLELGISRYIRNRRRERSDADSAASDATGAVLALRPDIHLEVTVFTLEAQEWPQSSQSAPLVQHKTTTGRPVRIYIEQCDHRADLAPSGLAKAQDQTVSELSEGLQKSGLFPQEVCSAIADEVVTKSSIFVRHEFTAEQRQQKDAEGILVRARQQWALRSRRPE